MKTIVGLEAGRDDMHRQNGWPSSCAGGLTGVANEARLTDSIRRMKASVVSCSRAQLSEVELIQRQ